MEKLMGKVDQSIEDIGRLEAKESTWQGIIARQAEGLVQTAAIETKLTQIVNSIEEIKNNEDESFALAKVIESQTSELVSIKARMDTNDALQEVIKGQVTTIQAIELERLRESNLEQSVENATAVFTKGIEQVISRVEGNV